MINEIKLCECGCGQPAPIAKRTHSKLGMFKGKPIRFIQGHFSKTSTHKKLLEEIHRRQIFHRGTKHPNWKGGKIKGSSGYMWILIDGKYKQEHRHIMELSIGRKLLPTEVVHHVNGIKTDNRIKNLTLMTASTHSSMHMKEKLALCGNNLRKLNCKS